MTLEEKYTKAEYFALRATGYPIGKLFPKKDGFLGTVTGNVRYSNLHVWVEFEEKECYE